MMVAEGKNMKIVGRILIVLVIAIPIFMCIKTLQTVWNEPNDSNKVVSSNTADTDTSGNLKDVEKLINNEENKVTASNLGDNVNYDVTGINIISKVYSDAEVAVSIANIYEEHDETSKVVGKLEKGSHITVQNYDNGWSTVTNYTYSGWMKTENIKLPDEGTNMVITQTPEEATKTGTVKVNDGLNVRASASTTADVITSLSNGTTVYILDDATSGWYKIKVGSTTGWVKSDFITVNN